MPFPALLVWGAAAGVAALGVKKGYDAYSDFDCAKSIGSSAETKYKKAEKELEKARKNTQEILVALGELKATAFSDQIRHLVDMHKRFGSQLKGYKEKIYLENLPEVEIEVQRSSELLGGVSSGVASGALLSFGTYGTVGLLATASTGTAIGSLTGVAATNATLAWLGGGSLAAGGFGMAGGMIALGGIALAPVLAIGGFVMAGKAERALTDARKYEADVDVAVAKMDEVKVLLSGIRAKANEQAQNIMEMVKRFDDNKVWDLSDTKKFERMCAIGKGLKGVLSVPVMNPDGTPNENLRVECDGYLKMGYIKEW